MRWLTDSVRDLGRYLTCSMGMERRLSDRMGVFRGLASQALAPHPPCHTGWDTSSLTAPPDRLVAALAHPINQACSCTARASHHKPFKEGSRIHPTNRNQVNPCLPSSRSTRRAFPVLIIPLWVALAGTEMVMRRMQCMGHIKVHRTNTSRTNPSRTRPSRIQNPRTSLLSRPPGVFTLPKCRLQWQRDTNTLRARERCR